MIKQLTRRMKCECFSCKALAKYVVGTKGVEFPICEKHFSELKIEIESISAEAKVEPSAIAKEETGITEAIEEVVAEKEPEATEYYECKHCHEKFPKSEMTAAQFATHSRTCKKEHSK